MVGRAVDLLVAKLEKDRLGKTSRPRAARSAKRGHVTRETCREVYSRDGEQCTFVSDEGIRCTERGFLELDHIHARALDGSDSPLNLRLACRSHNGLYAEATFGKEHIARKIASRRRASATKRRLDERAEAQRSRETLEQSPALADLLQDEGVIDRPEARAQRMGLRRARSTLRSTTVVGQLKLEGILVGEATNDAPFSSASGASFLLGLETESSSNPLEIAFDDIAFFAD